VSWARALARWAGGWTVGVRGVRGADNSHQRPRAADRQLRDVGRQLAGQRDAAALVEACDKLRKWLGSDEGQQQRGAGELEALAVVRAELVRALRPRDAGRRKVTWRRACTQDKARQDGKPVDLEPLAETLADARGRLALWFPGEPFLSA
jgi:hypothetical protein